MTDIIGVFKIYQDGKLIAEKQNNITQNGRVLAIKTLLGAIPSFGTSIGIGVGETANNIVSGLATNSRLDFKVASAPVTSSFLSPESSYDGLVFKAKIIDPMSYRIKEIGLFSDSLNNGATNYRVETLISFEPSDNLEYTDGTDLSTTSGNSRIIGTSDSPNFRIGDKALELKATATNSLPAVVANNVYTGLDSYSAKDLISVAFYTANTSASIDVTFYTDASNYSTYRFPAGIAGYRVISLEKGSTPQATAGTLNWANITKIKVQANTGDCILDGIRMEDVSRIDTNNGLVSRAVLGSEISKITNTPLDIEYYLRLGFNV